MMNPSDRGVSLSGISASLVANVDQQWNYVYRLPDATNIRRKEPVRRRDIARRNQPRYVMRKAFFAWYVQVHGFPDQLPLFL